MVRGRKKERKRKVRCRAINTLGSKPELVRSSLSPFPSYSLRLSCSNKPCLCAGAFKTIALLWLFAEYRRVPEAFIPDENYRCWPSYHHKGCLLSVFDVNEAIEICDSYSQCKAFVLTNQTTWTGKSQMLQSRSSIWEPYCDCFNPSSLIYHSLCCVVPDPWALESLKPWNVLSGWGIPLAMWYSFRKQCYGRPREGQLGAHSMWWSKV